MDLISSFFFVSFCCFSFFDKTFRNPSCQRDTKVAGSERRHDITTPSHTNKRHSTHEPTHTLYTTANSIHQNRASHQFRRIRIRDASSALVWTCVLFFQTTWCSKNKSHVLSKTRSVLLWGSSIVVLFSIRVREVTGSIPVCPHAFFSFFSGRFPDYFSSFWSLFFLFCISRLLEFCCLWV